MSGLFFSFISEASFPSLYGMLREFPEDLPLVKREMDEGLYSAGAYYAAKQLALLPGFIIGMFVLFIN